ncbi:MAG TPA: GTPase ObgE [Spirochaetia bacterium]|nr:GTPase ObgE [Spirochaetia bacterium]
MIGFADETYIDVSSGKGGNGAVSFRREKYVPKGGPDGGDGGAGGDVIFVVRKNLKTLAHLKLKRVYRAEDGRPGMGRRKHGKDGNSVEIPVPPGTIIKDAVTGETLADLTEEGEWVFLKGGKGGKGNWHFATSVRQAPRFAEEGKPGVSVRVHVELSIVADIGFVGFPNAGKSSLLGVVTNANPKVADYAFTTRIPNLGVMSLGERDIVLADIPGIIEGASHGAGMGFRFLKHIERTKGLAYLIDLSSEDYADAFPVLRSELSQYSAVLAAKKHIIVGTKLDLPGTQGRLKELAELFPEEKIIGISAHTHEGLELLEQEFLALCES